MFVIKLILGMIGGAIGLIGGAIGLMVGLAGAILGVIVTGLACLVLLSPLALLLVLI